MPVKKLTREEKYVTIAATVVFIAMMLLLTR